MIDLSFFKGKRILLTGHTGFKGSWLSLVLANAGAEVTGYSDVVRNLSLFSIARIADRINHTLGDIRDYDLLRVIFEKIKPEIVIHMAAQPLVRDSYNDPIYTYETNVMGTVNILECTRSSSSVKSFLNVTTDKVYYNKEWEWPYRENDMLDGYDPYSNSKSCSELVTHCYARSFFADSSVSISTARAGNVIGGGDFANDRIIPDCVRSAKINETIFVRNPNSVRPYQHVLEPLLAYLLICEKQYSNRNYMGSYNIGPDLPDCITTGELVELFCKYWGNGLDWKKNTPKNSPHEANFLKLDCSRIKSVFGWSPKWNVKKAVKTTVDWTKEWLDNKNIIEIMQTQIKEYLES